MKTSQQLIGFKEIQTAPKLNQKDILLVVFYMKT
jgi:hypothetical protein